MKKKPNPLKLLFEANVASFPLSQIPSLAVSDLLYPHNQQYKKVFCFRTKHIPKLCMKDKGDSPGVDQ